VSHTQRKIGTPEWLVLTGGCVFILVLIVSAVFEADIRWLHFFQSLMYVVAIVLTLRGSAWGYFIGFSIAVFWDYGNLAVTTFLANGVAELLRWIQTGHVARPDQMIAIPAWLGNLLVIIGCAWAYSRQTNKSWRDLTRFLIAFALSTGFFAIDMALFQPRYLALFPRMLHPHLPSVRTPGSR
jgi:hypothetical protein